MTDWTNFRTAVLTAFEQALPPSVLETTSVGWSEDPRLHTAHHVLLSVVSSVFEDRDSSLSTGGVQRLESMAVITVQAQAESSFLSDDLDALWLLEQLRLRLRKVTIRAALEAARIVVRTFPAGTRTIGGTADGRSLSAHAIEVVFCAHFELEPDAEDAGLIERIEATGELDDGLELGPVQVSLLAIDETPEP